MPIVFRAERRIVAVLAKKSEISAGCRTFCWILSKARGELHAHLYAAVIIQILQNSFKDEYFQPRTSVEQRI